MRDHKSRSPEQSYPPRDSYHRLGRPEVTEFLPSLKNLVGNCCRMDNYGQMTSDSTAWPLESSHISEQIIKDVHIQVPSLPLPLPKTNPLFRNQNKSSLLLIQFQKQTSLTSGTLVGSVNPGKKLNFLINSVRKICCN